MSAPITKDEFIERFVAHMVKSVGPCFTDGSSIEDYAREVAPSYYEEQHRDDPDETPEDCADADMSYWG
ncbi:hypothetical protein D2T29_12625 [Sinirhodobacter populi]|uniref:Uncharacterized protein n=1 Tax=Paenirhodobacter populi TaxID=2306993 RepID=A0A443KCE9_9RHOB|nr:hypothetical protein [Sinirhodobacter populi]RWR30509.1 hypothetical protein D2T29_12625 [Sinirhodobacter populi]